MSAPSQLTVARRLFDLAWPIVGLNVLQVLALAVDTAMVGRTPEHEVALTGMGYAAQLSFLALVAMIGLTVGAVAFVARAYGATEHDRVNHLLQQSTQLTVLLGIAVGVFGNLLADPMMRLLGAEGAELAAGLAYFRPLLAGQVFAFLNILFAAVLRGVRNTQLAFMVSVVMNALNFVFNYGLILGNFGLPALGIAGAAYGTVLSQACAVVLMLVLLARGAVHGIRPPLRWCAFDWPLARDLVRVGWPASADMLVLNASFLSILGMLGRIDQSAVAAHGIGLRIQALAFVPGMSISQATGALVGNALGAGRVEEARKVLRASVVLATVVMTAVAAVIIGLHEPIIQVFDIESGTELFRYSETWLLLLGYGMPIVGLYISFAGLLRGSGATRLSLRINAVVSLGMQIPASYLLGFPLGMGAWGVWAAFPLSFVFKGIWAWWEYRREEWAKVGARA